MNAITKKSGENRPLDQRKSDFSDIDRQWLAEFEAQAKRPLPIRIRYGFIKTYKPVMDDKPYRSFNTMEEYRKWCNDELPDWLGYGSL